MTDFINLRKIVEGEWYNCEYYGDGTPIVAKFVTELGFQSHWVSVEGHTFGINVIGPVSKYVNRLANEFKF